MILAFNKTFPVINESLYVAENAAVIGDVVLGKDSSVWFNTVIRGDVNYIRIAERTNIQDGCILHVTKNKFPLIIGSDVTIGHNAVVHGCTIKDKVLIGMGAIILDGSLINSNSIIAAGSVVKEGFVIPEGVLAAGVPAKVIRELTNEEVKNIVQSAANYVEYAKTYQEMVTKV